MRGKQSGAFCVFICRLFGSVALFVLAYLLFFLFVSAVLSFSVCVVVFFLFNAKNGNGVLRIDEREYARVWPWGLIPLGVWHVKKTTEQKKWVCEN